MKKIIRHPGLKFSLWVLCAKLALPLGAAETIPATALALNNSTNAAALPLRPGREDGLIAYITARLLKDLHYTHQTFDRSVSTRFFDQYLEMFDPQRLHFTQADLLEFAPYRTNLDNLTFPRNGPELANTSPGYEIFLRFLQRLKEKTAYADELLKNETFNFDADERIVTDRRELPHPKDLDAAKQLWRERLRYEYLQEKIARLESEKKKTNSLAGMSNPVVTFLTNGGTVKWSSNEVSGIVITNAIPIKTMEQQIADKLSSRYHRTLRIFEDWDGGDVLQYYLTALARVYDPHSEYMGKSGKQSFEMQMNLSLFGIGAELLSEDDGYCRIRRLMAGGPAIKSGKLKAGELDGDRIVTVAQGDQPPVDVVGMSLPKIVQQIRGPKGTEVRLTLLSANSSELRTVSLIRDEIPLEDQAAKAKLIELTADNGQKTRIGVIDLPSFYARVGTANGPSSPQLEHYTSVDVAKLLKKLIAEKVDGVILDLRRNGGGSLEECIKLTGLFIKDGPVVQVKDPFDRLRVDEDPDPSVLYDGPLMVLTSRFSASASEILAGALQDYGRALIVGDITTHGKGTVQNVNPLRALPYIRWPASYTNDPGSLKVTIHKFYRPGGTTTQFKGVLPDIVLPSPLNHLKDIGERSLDYPLPEGDPISRAKFEPVNRVEPYLSDLLKFSSARIATNQDFAYIREDIEHVRRKQADKTASLNEKQVLKEMDEDEARRTARNQERASRKAPSPIIREFTLKQLDLPGLTPVEKTNSLAGLNLDSTNRFTFITTNSISTDVTGLNLTYTTTNSFTATNSISINAKATEPSANPGDNISEMERSDAARLEEAERILVDYLSLLSRHSLAATTKDRTVDSRTP